MYDFLRKFAQHGQVEHIVTMRGIEGALTSLPALLITLISRFQQNLQSVEWHLDSRPP